MTRSRPNDKALFWLTMLYVAVAVLFTGWLLVRRFCSAQPAADSRSTFHDDVRQRLVEQVFSANAHLRDENSDIGDNEGTSITQKVERRRETQRFLTGQLKPTDCIHTQVACLKAENCTLLCKNASVLDFDCVKGMCTEKPIGVGGGDSDRNDISNDPSNCDLKNGEIGLLVGYNEIGTAQWECVQLYPGWEKRSTYCEGGTVDIDARVRTPSYRDCMCPGGTTRMTYRRSTLGQTVYGLPHCIHDAVVKFYEIDYEER